MKGAALGAAVALAVVAAASTASAKFGMRLTLSDRTPAVGVPVQLRLRTDMTSAEARTAIMRLVAVPPGIAVSKALLTEGRYRLRLTRADTTWRATFRFPRAGRWHLVVPNWGAPGWASPLPVDRVVVVSRA